ncbi:hypothetical protein Q8A67_018002 [Cirrhinus molitorella]|uniref:Uncharacterized protein n=1 Tax=Cirrhinus molitorella TaxID=172907 RepID=A0AA88PGT7_9TELE|nr:hypothetical protein Q8A67_018002 [Cirrhinus molitorella]
MLPVGAVAVAAELSQATWQASLCPTDRLTLKELLGLFLKLLHSSRNQSVVSGRSPTSGPQEQCSRVRRSV